jgi:DNA-binding response OmpR family regulator
MTNILVVCEERSIRQAIKFELEDEGFIVIDVNDYEDALSAFNAFKCALVISDISDEKGNGMRLLKRFKDEPFIAITTFPDSLLGKQARSILKDRFFEKPFSIKLLISKVHETINSNYTYADAV